MFFMVTLAPVGRIARQRTPSPTAEPTRLVELAERRRRQRLPDSLFPAEEGDRANGHFVFAPGWKSGPVQTNPCSSARIDSGTNLVLGMR
jgi:uncharacterized iron-regulated membrane protein